MTQHAAAATSALHEQRANQFRQPLARRFDDHRRHRPLESGRRQWPHATSLAEPVAVSGRSRKRRLAGRDWVVGGVARPIEAADDIDGGETSEEERRGRHGRERRPRAASGCRSEPFTDGARIASTTSVRMMTSGSHRLFASRSTDATVISREATPPGSSGG